LKDVEHPATLHRALGHWWASRIRCIGAIWARTPASAVAGVEEDEHGRSGA